MKPLKLYLDTSVIGGCHDGEFSLYSNRTIEKIKQGKYIAVISDITILELAKAPEKVANIIKEIPSEFFIQIDTSGEIEHLAHRYISELILPEYCGADALHIACASVYGVDLLLSWNFKHIVNYQRILGFNSINIREGYKSLEIRSPMELVYEE